MGTEIQAQDLSHFLNIDIPLVLLDNYLEEQTDGFYKAIRKNGMSTSLHKRKSC